MKDYSIVLINEDGIKVYYKVTAINYTEMKAVIKSDDMPHPSIKDMIDDGFRILSIHETWSRKWTL